jgi:4-amino-4-deoxy-L-arabinose transferase-like glycosyltransferase
MLLLAFFFFWPAIKMWRSKKLIRYMPFLLAFFAVFIFWMCLSFQFYKTFWALWMLMAIVAADATPQANDNSRRTGRRGSSVGSPRGGSAPSSSPPTSFLVK